MWKIPYVRVILLLFVVFCLAGLPACSGSKVAAKPVKVVSGPDAALISQGEDEVKAKLGQPTVISKTTEGHVLWTYRPPWKILPNDKGTLYVEFNDGKAIKIFKKD